MRFDRVFLCADAVTAEDGICEADHAQTRPKELMTRRGNSVHVLADSSKLGLRPFHAWARLALLWDPSDGRRRRPRAGAEVPGRGGAG
jgi:DeoR/GlpR family transcriptional regulator of sugar metabolism